MNLSLRSKVFSVSLAGIALSAAMAIVTHVQFSRISSNQAQRSIAESALRNQVESDMMHDALRADVLTALRIAARKDVAGRSEVLTNLAEHVDKFRGRVKENEELPVTAGVRTALQAVKEPLDIYIRSAEEMVDLAFKDPAAAEARYDAFTEKFEALEGRMEKVSDVIEQSCKEQNAVTDALVKQFLPMVGGTVAGGAVALFLLSLLVARSIPRPFQKLIEDLAALSTAVGGASNEVATASQTLANDASAQAAALEETSASLEEMTSMVNRNAEAAAKAKTIASETRIAADAGTSDMTEMKTAMNEIRTSSGEIAKIVKAIDEIAFQTNILALNAAVEAARAGEAGAGFAVVADEVRSLAQRSALSARETAEKIEVAIAKSERGVQISNKVGASFEAIASKTREVDQYVAEIATASKEQAQGVTQVNVAVTQMDKVTQRNAATAEESAAASQELKSQAAAVGDVVHSLQNLVGGSRSARATTVTAPEDAPALQAVPAAKCSPQLHLPQDGAHHSTLVSAPARSTAPQAKETGFMDF